MPIEIGRPAPSFSALGADGRRVSSADYLGKQTLVVFFYPKDGTSVCTKEACAFRDAYQDFVEAGAAVIGVSADSDDSHRSFAAGHRLPYTLLSDRDGALRKLFGVGKTLGLIPGRVTFVIDKAGTVRHVFSALLASDRHVVEALATVRNLAKS